MIEGESLKRIVNISGPRGIRAELALSASCYAVLPDRNEYRLGVQRPCLELHGDVWINGVKYMGRIYLGAGAEEDGTRVWCQESRVSSYDNNLRPKLHPSRSPDANLYRSDGGTVSDAARRAFRELASQWISAAQATIPEELEAMLTEAETRAYELAARHLREEARRLLWKAELFAGHTVNECGRFDLPEEPPADWLPVVLGGPSGTLPAVAEVTQ